MKRGLFVGLALLWASTSWAQAYSWGSRPLGLLRTTAIGGVVETDSSVVPVRISTTRALSTYDEARDRDMMHTWDLFSGTLAVAGADSNTTAVPCASYNYLKLLIKAHPVAGVNTVVRLAFQFREVEGNITGDSLNTYAEYRTARIDRSTTASTAVDTLLLGHNTTGTVTLPWSGEYVVQISGNRAGTGPTGTPLIFSYPNGIAISLDELLGHPVQFGYLQVRMRNLNQNSPSVVYNVKLKGFRK